MTYSKNDIDPSKKINIKAYDDAKCLSKAVIMLQIKVGTVTQNIRLQVLDLDLPYNMILGHPWIHAMKAVPSMYHQCIQFPYNGVEVTIPTNPDPFQFYELERNS